MSEILYVGSSRTGSTWLANQLSANSGLYMPVKKPVRFWNLKLYGGKDPKNSHPELTIDSYLELMKSNNNQKSIDMTDGYNILGIHAIKQIKQWSSARKVFFTLRNPVDMIISHFLLKNDVAHLEENVSNVLEDKYSYISLNADQAECISKWQYVFGKDDVGIFWYDDLKRNPRNYVKNICQFLDIPNEYIDLPPVNQRKFQSNPSHEVFNYIKASQRSNILKLSALLDVDLAHWIS